MSDDRESEPTPGEEGGSPGDSAATDEFDRVVAAVRERVDPGPDERRALSAAAGRLLERTREAAADLPVETDVIQVGSTARGTWVSGDRDVDVFVRFPPDLDRETLEEYGLRVGHRVLPEGREEYAEHPYVTGTFEGFDVDLVPCYRLEDASEVQSAVDRTPFHTEYLAEHLDADLTADVRLVKALLKGVGVYGSDLRTRGVGGYLAELLVLEYGGARPLLSAIADWQPPIRLDPGETGSDARFEDPLVVIDPTDPDRNVASVVAAESLAAVQHYARAFLAEPRESLFEPRNPAPLSPAEVREHVRERGTTPVALVFPAPDVVDDQLYPQLRRTCSNLADELRRRGFQPLRSRAFAEPAGDDGEGENGGGSDGSVDGGESASGDDDGDREDDAGESPRAVVLIECAVGELSTVQRHEGPPVAVREHAAGFYEKYEESGAYGPFVEGDRYVVEREREYRTPGEALAGVLFDVGVGPAVERAVEDEHRILVGEEVADLAEREGLAVELRRYFEPRP